MQSVILDFETYYADDYTLSKMTNESYVRDPRFYAHGVGLVWDNGHREWVEHDAIPARFAEIDWTQTVVICHHSHFDNAILSWIYNVSPVFMCCTLCMARALFPGSSVSLDNITKKLGITVSGQGKGIMQTKNKPRLTPQESYQLGVYCLQDCDLTKILFDRMKALIPLSELQLIDLNIRMFTEPVLQLNTALLQEAYDEEVEAKREMMERANADRTLLGSNEALAQMFESLGVEAPMKLSPAGLKKNPPEEKWVYAFSKSDEEFLALQEHEDPKVRALVEARLGIKSTLKETRTQRMLGIASRGPMPIYYNYYGAHSGRFSGGDKNNPQNWTRGSKIRLAVEAPTDHVLVVRDLSQIEARVLACLAGQWDIVEAFEQERDVYSEMASVIFGRKVDRKKVKEDFIPGFIGKAVVLGCISEGMRVFTNKGLVPIELVTTDMKVWDGEEFVIHEGVIYKGFQRCIKRGLLWATPDHKILAETALGQEFERFDSASYYVDTMMHSQPLRSISDGQHRKVYDILECGPRNRFVVENMVVHNCGYGLGWKKFQAMIRVGMLGMKGIIFDGPMMEQLGVNLANFNSRYGKDVEATKPLALTYDQHLIHCAVAKFIIDTFRNNNPEIVKLWKQCQTALEYMLLDEPVFDVGVEPVLEVGHESIWLPNDMRICYPHLKKSGKEFSTMKKKGNKIEVSKAYGGLVTENCLTANTKILTPYGWKSIVDLQHDELVFDGEAFVPHSGVVCRGEQEVIDFGGIGITPDHEVLINGTWIEAGDTTPRRAASSCRESFGEAIWEAHGNSLRGKQWHEIPMDYPLLLWHDESTRWYGVEKRKDQFVRVPSSGISGGAITNPRHEPAPSVRGMAKYVGSMQAAKSSGISQLRSKGYNGLRTVARKLRELLGGYGANLCGRSYPGSDGQQPGILQGELSLGGSQNPSEKQAEQQGNRHTPGEDALVGSGRGIRDWSNHAGVSNRNGVGDERPLPEAGLHKQTVYDILNTGPNRRFVVLTDFGPVVVHNCVQALARIVVTDAMLKMKQEGMRVVMMTHDEIIVCAPENRAQETYDRMGEIMAIRPSWSPSLPLASEGGFARNYSK